MILDTTLYLTLKCFSLGQRSLKCPPPRHLKHSLLFSTVFTLSWLERSLNFSHLHSPCCPEHTGQLLFVPISLLELLCSSLCLGSALVAKVVILVRVLPLLSSLSGLAIRSQIHCLPALLCASQTLTNQRTLVFHQLQ